MSSRRWAVDCRAPLPARWTRARSTPRKAVSPPKSAVKSKTRTGCWSSSGRISPTSCGRRTMFARQWSACTVCTCRNALSIVRSVPPSRSPPAWNCCPNSSRGIQPLCREHGSGTGHPQAATAHAPAAADQPTHRYPYLGGRRRGECRRTRLSPGLQHLPDLLLQPASVEALHPDG